MTRIIAVVLVGSAACTPHAFSPPARIIPLEAPATVAEGTTSVAVEGGVSGEVFGEPIIHGTARVRHGLSDRLELSGEANVLHFRRDQDTSTTAHRGVYSARLGIKGGFSEHFALTAGLGGGGSASSSFLSPDAGFIAGYTNPYATPFLGARVFLSQPLTQNEVTITDNEETYVGAPETSYGVALSTGVRVPFGPRDDRTGAISAGYGFTVIADDDEHRTFQGFNLGLDLAL